MTPAQFFEALYGDRPPGYRPLWCRQSKATVWLDAADNDGAGAEVEKLSQASDVYFGVGLQRKRLTPGERGGADDVIGIPGLWADIDIADGAAHKQPALPPDVTAAAGLAASFPLPPTLLVHSGHGLQAWWLFKSPWLFQSDAERALGADLAERFQATLRQEAERSGWKLDATADLARVLRPPGSWNRKIASEPKPVRVIRCDLARRYDAADFERHIVPDQARATNAAPRGPDPTPFDEAVARYNVEHTREWPSSGGTCPACGHRECFGQLASQPDRWACFSANHEQPGLRGSGCYHGDVLDLDAHASRRSRAEQLRATGYLASDPPAPQSASKPEGRQLRVVAFREVKPDFAKAQLVPGWLDHGTVNVVFGASNTGKSFLVLDLALHVAMGWTWFGRRVGRGGVVYVAAEAPSSIERRVYAMKLHYRLAEQDVPLWIVPEPVNLVRDGGDVEALSRTIGTLANGLPITLVIVDTLATVMAGGDENSFETMGALVGNLLALRQRTSAAVLGVHHAGKDQERGARGHSSLKAAVDTEIELRRDGEARVAVISKARDGETGTRIGFELQPIVVGRGSDGSPVEVPIVVHLSSDQIRRPLEGQRLALYLALEEAYENKSIGVDLETWRNAFVEKSKGRMKKRSSAVDTFTRQYRTLIPEWVTTDPNGYVPARSVVDPSTSERASEAASVASVNVRQTDERRTPDPDPSRPSHSYRSDGLTEPPTAASEVSVGDPDLPY